MGILGLPRGFWDPPDGILGPPPPDSGPARGNSAPSLPNELVNSISPSPHCGPPPVPKLVLTGLPQPGSQFFVAQFCSFSGGFGSNPTPNPPGFGRSAAIPGRPRPQCLLEPQILREKPQTRGRNRRKTAAFAPKRRRGGQGEPTAVEFWGKKEPKMGFSGLRRISFLPSIFFRSFGPSLSGLMANLAITKWRRFGELIFDPLVLFFYPF